MKQLRDLEAQTLALAIVDTLPEPFLVLDDSLRLMAGSRCFYEVFGEDPASTRGCSLFDLSGQWDIPGLRPLLAEVADDHTTVDSFEFEREAGNLGKRTLHLSARPILGQAGSGGMILVAISDITDRRRVEQDKQQLQEHTDELLQQQKTLLREMRHRVANSLQIIASVLLLKAGAVTSEETKNELLAAHQRVMSVAAVQGYLHASHGIEQIDVAPYLTKLGSGLASSMVDPEQEIAITVTADSGVLPTSHAVSIGLIVTELIINAVKYAFPDAHSSSRIRVTFEMADSDWKLTVADNGAGRRERSQAYVSTGLGTALVAALAKQLNAQVSETSSAGGLTIAVTCGPNFESHRLRAA